MLLSDSSRRKECTRKMSSDRRRKKRYNSAKKRARQGKMWLFPVVLLLCVLVGLTGAAAIYFVYSPLKYSDEEVGDYVHSIYGDSWTLVRKKKADGEQGGMNTYLYENKGEGSFSVFSMSVPLEEDGISSGYSRKALYDNYFRTRIENNIEEIEKLAKQTRDNYGPELSVEVTGESAGAFGAQYSFHLYLENPRQIESAASLIAQMDKMLSFSCEEGKEPWSRMRPKMPCVHLYMRPNRGVTGGADAVTAAAKRGSDPDAAAALTVPVDWRSTDVRAGYEISTIPFTDLSSPSRLTSQGLFTRIENDYVDAARTFGKEHYSVTDEQVEKYPAPVLTLINVGGHDLTGKNQRAYTYQFVYCRETGTYWMTGLDPCEDFDGNPYGDYPRRGAFSNLVTWLGGSFTAQDWTGSWRIGSTRWEAALDTKKMPGLPYAYKSLKLTCDGNITLLDKVPEVFSGTGAVPSGRPFSIRDLIRMLDVRITINQKKMTAVMFRDFEDE